MIKPAGQAMSAAIEAAKLRESGSARALARTLSKEVSPSTTGAAGTLAAMARLGAPIDVDKIQRIKSAIASGNYPVDADAIADRMVELDMPRSFN